MWGWMIVLVMVVSFVIGCVNQMCRSFLLECVFLFFSTIVFGLVFICLAFPCLWEISFSNQMISRTLNWLLGLHRISSDHKSISAVRRRSWRELDSWSFGGRLFLSSVQDIFMRSGVHTFTNSQVYKFLSS